MKTLTWQHTDWFEKHFIFKMEQQVIGQLIIDSSWNINAEYTDKETKLIFAQKSFWNRDVLITREGKMIGEIHIGLFGEQTLYVVTGEKFFLSTSLWEQEAYWKTEKGETVIKFQQMFMSSVGKGMINSQNTLTIEMEKLLISSGVFIRQLKRKQTAAIVAVMIPIIASASR
jgi:hypothetical protein